jgi:hypothetical protein
MVVELCRKINLFFEHMVFNLTYLNMDGGLMTKGGEINIYYQNIDT